jgi:hypothetical protein
MTRSAVLILGLLFLAGCAKHYAPQAAADPYGFFVGIWHGVIIPFSAIGGLFVDDVQIIGRPNTGLWYYVGFGLGLLTLSASAIHRGAARR